MQCNSLLIKILVSAVLIANLSLASAVAHDFSKDDILSDFAHLKTSLVESHFAPFTSISEAQFEREYARLLSQINETRYNQKGAIDLFQQLLSTINNGHTELDFPAQAYLDYANQGGTVFPLELAFENNRALVRKDYTKSQNSLIGAELMSINSLAIKDVLNEIYPYISAERLYLKHAKLELFSLPRYYWRVFGEQCDFDVTLRLQSGQIKQFKFPAIRAIAEFESVREEIFKSEPSSFFITIQHIFIWRTLAVMKRSLE